MKKIDFGRLITSKLAALMTFMALMTLMTLLKPALARISQFPLFPSEGFSNLIYSSPALDGTSIAYRSGFTTKDWAGQLKAFRVNADGSIGAVVWDAERQIPAWQARNITSWNSETDNAIDFQSSQLSEPQKRELGSINVLSYLRGDSTLEAAQKIGNFRNRSSSLGDIVNSVPIYVKNADFGYTALPKIQGGGIVYRDFQMRKHSRKAMLYVGANDGMLHGFDAVTGAERFAYVPHALFPYLSALSHPDYVLKHRYFVDGQLTEGDAYFSRETASTPVWKTIVLGTTGAGARSVFALDVSAPALLSAKSVMWERSDVVSGGIIDHDMGHVLGEAAVVRLRSGQWAALYGNGYDSKNKKAVLYLVNITDGSLIRKIQTEQGGLQGPNGLSTPALQFNSHREVIAAYAGDLRGNIWKFDLESTNAKAWGVAYHGRPLYVATDPDGKPQPIVAQPVMARHPNGGRMIMFGTGKLFEVDDPFDTQFQTITAIWEQADPADRASTIEGRYQLQQQTLSPITGGRIISKNPVNWNNRRGWYVDLPDRGERVVGKLQMINGLLVILTYTPGMPAGAEKVPSSQIMLIDFMTGSAAPNPVFLASRPDQLSIRVPPSTASPTAVRLPNGKRSLVLQGIDGRQKIVPLALTPTLPFRTWHQLPVPH